MADFPLSRNQLGLWFDWHLAPERPLYNNATLFRIRSAVDLGAFERAWQRVVDRHGCFRSTLISGRDALPLQRRHDVWKAPFEVHDVPGATDAQISEALRRLHESPYDLERMSNVRMHVFRKAADDHVVMIRIHHLWHDHGSTDAMHAELFEAYEAEMRGSAPSWPALPFGYDDYVAREREFMSSPAMNASLEFWRAQLDGQTSDLDLPTDLATRVQQRGGATLTRRLAGRDALAAFCSEHGVSRFRAMLAAYVALLARYSGQTDITIGTPADTRGERFAGVAGYFVNLLPFRFRFRRDVSFLELSRHVDEIVRQTLAHRFVPFPVLVERFWRNAGAATPFCRTTFALTKVARCPVLDRPQMSHHLPWRAQLAGLSLCEPPPMPQQEGHFDLTLWTWDLEKDGLALEVKYDPQLFSREAADRFASHYERMLLGALARPDAPPVSSDIQADDERRFVSVALDRRVSAAFEPAQAGFERAAAERPEAEALVHGATSWTYAKLAAASRAIAAELQERGLRPGELVALLLPKRPETIAAMLGVLMAGGAFLPIDPTYPRDRIELMLNDAAPRLVVSDPERASLAKGREVIDLSSVRDGRAVRPVPAGPESLAYVIYTSGSTGRPKGVMVSHRGVAPMARALASDWSLAPGDRVLAFAPLSFDAFIADVFPAFMAGASVHLGDEPFAAAGKFLHDFMRRERITHVTLPPSVWLSMPAEPLPELKVGVSAGEPCPREVVTRWGRGRVFYNNYGPTEITVCATTKRCTLDEAPSIGTPIAGILARVLDDELRPVVAGCAGELFLGGEGLALGYLGREDLTRERFVSDRDGTRLYRSGDLVRLSRAGELEYVGRRDEQVKVRGFRIELAEIEEALRALPGVEDAAVAVKTIGGASVLAAYVIGRTDGVLADLRAALPKHMVPAIATRVETLPRSPSGKVDRAALPAPAGSVMDRVAPGDELEAAIAAVWKSVLGHADFGVLDDFFTVGGDSLSAVRVVHALEEHSSHALSPDVLFRHGTIRALADAIRTGRAGHAGSLVTLAQGRGPVFVLVHPAGGDLTAYRSLLDRLRGHEVVGLRSPGTVGGAEEQDVPALASRYLSELAAARLEHVWLVGWSFGGVVAQAMSAAASPNQLAGLVLLDASPTFPAHVRIPDADVPRPDLVQRHARMYERHRPSPTTAPALVCWAEKGAHARGGWNEFCNVIEEMTIDTSHEGVLCGPHVDEVVDWFLRPALEGR